MERGDYCTSPSGSKWGTGLGWGQWECKVGRVTGEAGLCKVLVAESRFHKALQWTQHFSEVLDGSGGGIARISVAPA